MCHAIAGIAAEDWLRVLRENRFAVDAPYRRRAALITLNSLLNSVYRAKENRTYARAVASVKIEPPLFILGHWRSGTTHLYNLLAVDRRFAYPNHYQVLWPHTFLSTEGTASRFIASWFPERRMQDNVSIRLDRPEEDEFALSITTGWSPIFMSLVFPRRALHYERYFTFREVSQQQIVRWKTAFVWFLKKLTWKYGRPLLLKSPPHTSRIRLLLELFPDARFVHIHRNPYHVFQSYKAMRIRISRIFRLQRPDWQDVDDLIIRNYQTMYEAFFAERELIPAGNFHEIGFEELEADPMGQLRTMYGELNLPGFDAVEPSLQRYVASLRDYRKNEHAELDPSLRDRIGRAWQRSFEEWAYPR